MAGCALRKRALRCEKYIAVVDIRAKMHELGRTLDNFRNPIVSELYEGTLPGRTRLLNSSGNTKGIVGELIIGNWWATAKNATIVAATSDVFNILSSSQDVIESCGGERAEITLDSDIRMGESTNTNGKKRNEQHGESDLMMRNNVTGKLTKVQVKLATAFSKRNSLCVTFNGLSSDLKTQNVGIVILKDDIYVLDIQIPKSK